MSAADDHDDIHTMDKERIQEEATAMGMKGSQRHTHTSNDSMSDSDSESERMMMQPQLQRGRKRHKRLGATVESSGSEKESGDEIVADKKRRRHIAGEESERRDAAAAAASSSASVSSTAGHAVDMVTLPHSSKDHLFFTLDPSYGVDTESETAEERTKRLALVSLIVYGQPCPRLHNRSLAAALDQPPHLLSRQLLTSRHTIAGSDNDIVAGDADADTDTDAGRVQTLSQSAALAVTMDRFDVRLMMDEVEWGQWSKLSQDMNIGDMSAQSNATLESEGMDQILFIAEDPTDDVGSSQPFPVDEHQVAAMEGAALEEYSALQRERYLDLLPKDPSSGDGASGEQCSDLTEDSRQETVTMDEDELQDERRKRERMRGAGQEHHYTYDGPHSATETTATHSAVTEVNTPMSASPSPPTSTLSVTGRRPPPPPPPSRHQKRPPPPPPRLTAVTAHTTHESAPLASPVTVEPKVVAEGAIHDGMIEQEKPAKDEEKSEVDTMDQPFTPNFPLPEGMIIPRTLREHLIISHCARFIVSLGSRGPQQEILLRLQHRDNIKFYFLQHDHPLQPYYAFIRDNQPEEVMQMEEQDKVEERKEGLPSPSPPTQRDSVVASAPTTMDHATTQLTPSHSSAPPSPERVNERIATDSLSALVAYGDSDDDNDNDNDNTEAAANGAVVQPVNNAVVDRTQTHGESMNQRSTTKLVEVVPSSTRPNHHTPPTSAAMQNLISPRECSTSTRTIPSLPLPPPPPLPPSLPIPSSLFHLLPPPPHPFPPTSMLSNIHKLCALAHKYGIGYEKLTAARERLNPAYEFLTNATSIYQPYYQWAKDIQPIIEVEQKQQANDQQVKSAKSSQPALAMSSGTTSPASIDSSSSVIAAPSTSQHVASTALATAPTVIPVSASRSPSHPGSKSASDPALSSPLLPSSPRSLAATAAQSMGASENVSMRESMTSDMDRLVAEAKRRILAKLKQKQQ